MRRRSSLHLPMILFFFLCLLTMDFQARAFIQRRYTLEEVLNACTNVVFGTVTSVNRQRLTVRVTVDEDLKGKSDRQEIQINLAVGQGNFPQKMIKQFEAEFEGISRVICDGVDCIGGSKTHI